MILIKCLNFLKGKKFFVKRKDNLPRFCDNHGIQMVKFKREGSGGSTPTAYKIPTDTKLEQIRQSLMYNNNSVLGLELVKKKKRKFFKYLMKLKIKKNQKLQLQLKFQNH